MFSPALLKQIEKLLQGIGILANVADDGVQALQNLVGVFRQQAFGVLIVNLQGVFVLSGLHERVGEVGNRREIVVHGEQLVGERSGF